MAEDRRNAGHGRQKSRQLIDHLHDAVSETVSKLGYAIEVCVGRRVVLSLVWNRTGPIFLETYRPGAWETKLEEPNLTASLAA